MKLVLVLSLKLAYVYQRAADYKMMSGTHYFFTKNIYEVLFDKMYYRSSEDVTTFAGSIIYTQLF